MQEIDVISAAEKQARACCEQARQQAADLAAQAEKDGAARLLAVSAGTAARGKAVGRRTGTGVQRRAEQNHGRAVRGAGTGGEKPR